jgi:glycosyltransferase involved in cell wall biosynthesis
MSKKILFISHQAGRTGAPIVLLHLLRWLKLHSNFKFEVLLQQGGELEDEFRQVAKTYTWDLQPVTGIWQNRWQRFTNKQAVYRQGLLRKIKAFNPDIIYANTIVAATLGETLKQAIPCPLVCHVHELATVIEGFIGKEKFTQLSKNIDFFIAASDAVSVNLHRVHEVPFKSIHKVYEFVPALDAESFIDARFRIRQELGLADNAFVVAGAGSIDWRKAPDLFIQVAQHVCATDSTRTDFIWIGGSLDSSDGQKVRHDVVHAGVSSCVHFLGVKANPYDYLSVADVFLLTSREDPYPLVCLEAAALGSPIICFADAGGMPEFVEQDCGIVVPYLRSDLMAGAVLKLRSSDDLRKSLGLNAAQKLRQRHTIDLAGRQISELIRQFTAIY